MKIPFTNSITGNIRLKNGNICKTLQVVSEDKYGHANLIMWNFYRYFFQVFKVATRIAQV